MDDIFGEDDFFDFDEGRSNRVSEEEVRAEEKVYFVSYRWVSTTFRVLVGCLVAREQLEQRRVFNLYVFVY